MKKNKIKQAKNETAQQQKDKINVTFQSSGEEFGNFLVNNMHLTI